MTEVIGYDEAARWLSEHAPEWKMSRVETEGNRTSDNYYVLDVRVELRRPRDTSVVLIGRGQTLLGAIALALHARQVRD